MNEQQLQHSCIFNQAFLIPEGDQVATTAMETCLYVAAITFNLALVHQLQGRRSSLEKAESLYQMALKLLDLQTSCNQESSASLILQLAAINSIYQIHLDLTGDTYHCNTMATKAVHQVRDYVSNAETRGVDAESFDDPRVRGLLMNVVLLNSSDVAAAA